MKQIFSKGNIVLFVIALCVTMLAGIVTAAFTADKVNIVAASAMGGIVSLLIIGWLCDIAKYEMPIGPDAGVVGVLLGTVLTLIMY